MKRLTAGVLLLGIVVLGNSRSGHAQAFLSDHATVDAEITIVQAMSVQATGIVDFGVVQSGLTATYTLDAGGNVTGSSGAEAGGTPMLATFTIQGTPDRHVQLSIDSTDPVSGVNYTPAVYDEKGDPVSSGDVLDTGAAGDFDLTVGGEMDVTDSNVSEGTHTGEVTLTFEYTNL